MADVKQLLAEKDLATRHTEHVCLDGEALQRWHIAQGEHDDAAKAHDQARAAATGKARDQARIVAKERLDEAKRQLDAAAEQARQHMVEFHFRSLSASHYEALVAAHPPTVDQIAQARERDETPPTTDPDRWPQALLAATLVEPTFDSADEVDQLLRDKVSTGVWLQLVNAAVRVNQGASRVPLSLTASDTTPATG